MTHRPLIEPNLFKPLPPLSLPTRKPIKPSFRLQTLPSPNPTKPYRLQTLSLSPMTPIKQFNKRHPLEDPPPASSSSSASSSGEEDEQLSGKEEEKEVKNTATPSCKRLWTEEDEIVILKGMIEYCSQKGTDPYSALGKFHDFIKNSLSVVDASKSQFIDKVEKMKGKYVKTVEKGDSAVFLKPHDADCFELSKKVWGGGGAEKKRDEVDGSGKHWSKKPRTENGIENVKKEAGFVEALKGGEMNEDMEVDKLGVFWATHPCLKQSLALDLSIQEPGKSFILENMSIIGSVKAKELEKKWNDFCVDEVAVYLKQAELNKRRAEMIEEQTKLFLDAMKASHH